MCVCLRSESPSPPPAESPNKRARLADPRPLSTASSTHTTKIIANERGAQLTSLAPADATALARAILNPDQVSPELRVLRNALLRSRPSEAQESPTLDEEGEKCATDQRQVVVTYDEETSVHFVDLANLRAPDVAWEQRHKHRRRSKAAGADPSFDFQTRDGVGGAARIGGPVTD